MSTNRKSLAILLAFVILPVFLLVTYSKPAAAKVIKLRYSGSHTLEHFSTKEQFYFADEVKKRTDGRVVVEVYPAGELYSYRDVVDATSVGAVEMGYASGGHWAGRNPLFGFYNYFFMLADHDQYYKARDDLAKLLWPLWEKQNVKVLNWLHMGSLGLTTKKPVNKPEDIKGMMIRGSNPITMKMLKSLGAVPASLAMGEVYDALGKGAIDGATGGFSTAYESKWDEVADYYMGPMSVAFFLTFMNLDTWNRISPADQKTIMQVSKEVEEQNYKAGLEFMNKAIDYLKSKGKTVTVLTPQNRGAWEAASRPYWNDWVVTCEKAGYGKEAKELITILDNAK